MWKDINIELPNDNDVCLIVSEDGDNIRMVTAVCENDLFLVYNWFDDSLEEAEGFTHWMPRPLTPNELIKERKGKC